MDRLEHRARALGAAALLVTGLILAAAMFRAAGSSPLETDVLGRSVRMARPRWLALLACAPCLVAGALVALTDTGFRRRLAHAGLRFAFLTLLAVALARPTLEYVERAVSLVALVDVSTSMSDAALADAVGFVTALEQEAEKLDPRPSVRKIRFAAEPAEWPQSPAALPRLAGGLADETDLALALSFARGLHDPGRVPRLLVASDGRATRGEALAEAAAGRARIFYRHSGHEGRDVAVFGLTAPDEVRPRAAFDLEIRLVATHAGAARVRLARDGRPHAPVAERTVAFAPGLTTVRWPTTIDGAATALYRAEIAGADGNERAENDVGVLAIASRPRPRVLVLDPRSPGAVGFVHALTALGFECEQRQPRSSGGAGISPHHDLVVLSDVPHTMLDAAQQEALDRFVRGGGGLLVAGGPDSFGSPAAPENRFTALLPVRTEPADRREEATLAMALVIDRSGSMSGPKIELTKEAARGTAQMLAPDDLISIIVFDSQAYPVVRLQPASNRQRILNDISQIRASGGTNILPGLREAFDQLVAARARKKHVILLSDGQSPYEGIADLVDDSAAAQITVSAVGVGEGADQTLLQMIAARGGGRFYQTRDPSSIPQIFTRETAEVSGSSAVEEPTRLVATKPVEMLAGLALDSAPALRGHSRTRARNSAEVVLATGQGQPLLVRWQQGLGQVVAWTSDLAGRWSADLVRWPAYPKLWGQVARSAMRRGAMSHFPIRARLAGERVFAKIEAVGSDDRPLGGLRGVLDVVHTRAADEGPRISPPLRPPLAPFSVPLAESLPGVYETDFAAAAPGALLLSARLLDDRERPVATAQGSLSLPFARELLPAVPAMDADAPLTGRALLAALAERTGGAEAKTARTALDPGPDVTTGDKPLGTPILLVALALFLADVALRRARFLRS